MVSSSSPEGLVQQASQRERFQRLRDQWKAESRYLSNTAQMALLAPYQRIIGMGTVAVPLILEELRREPDNCFGRWRPLRKKTPFQARMQVECRR